MAGLAKENFQEEFELNLIRQNWKLHPKTRQSMIDDTKKSFHNKKKNPSWKTILHITNNMIGSSILIFPLVFIKYGVLNATFVLILMAAISCETCLLQIRHVKMNELDLPETILRILGGKWFYSYVISSFIFNGFSVLIYFILMNNLLYSMLEYFFVLGKEEPWIAPVTEFTFERFSKQWTIIIMAVVMLILYTISYLRYLLILCQYGITGIFIYVFFLFVKAIQNIYEGNVVSQTIKYVSPDISTLAGIFSLAFFVHNNLITIVKTNQSPDKNSRDVVLSFLLTAMVYLFIGIFGSLSVVGLVTEKTPQIVLDYFNDSIWTIIIDFLIFLQLISVSPLNWYIGRTQILELCYHHNPTPKIIVFLINFVFVTFCLGLTLLKVDVTTIISLNGAVCGYLMLYIIPIKLHLNCLYDAHDHEEKDVTYNGELLMKNCDLDYFGPDSPNISILKKNELREKDLIENLKMSKLGLEMEKNGCKSAHLTMIKRSPKWYRYLMYGILSIFGAVIALWSIVLICMGES